jgi:uncharacterized membrane protein YedE/YeeE
MYWEVKIMKILSTFLAGLLFGTGLILSGMANPAKVQNFLDLFGTWDPSLAFVMSGAIIVAMPGFWFTCKLPKPLFNDAFQLPTRKDFDPKLIAGAATFGIGWGLGGFCPGPALTALPFANTSTLFFVTAMLVGMMVAKFSSAPVLQDRAA